MHAHWQLEAARRGRRRRGRNSERGRRSRDDSVVWAQGYVPISYEGLAPLALNKLLFRTYWKSLVIKSVFPSHIEHAPGCYNSASQCGLNVKGNLAYIWVRGQYTNLPVFPFNVKVLG